MYVHVYKRAYKYNVSIIMHVAFVYVSVRVLQRKKRRVYLCV